MFYGFKFRKIYFHTKPMKLALKQAKIQLALLTI